MCGQHSKYLRDGHTVLSSSTAQVCNRGILLFWEVESLGGNFLDINDRDSACWRAWGLHFSNYFWDSPGWAFLWMRVVLFLLCASTTHDRPNPLLESSCVWATAPSCPEEHRLLVASVALQSWGTEWCKRLFMARVSGFPVNSTHSFLLSLVCKWLCFYDHLDISECTTLKWDWIF